MSSLNLTGVVHFLNCVGDRQHIRIDAKRLALDALDVQRSRVPPVANNGHGPETETIVEVSDELPSQSRHSLTLSGSPPHGKLLIPFERRDVRVVEGARLESDSGEAHRIVEIGRAHV